MAHPRYDAYDPRARIEHTYVPYEYTSVKPTAGYTSSGSSQRRVGEDGPGYGLPQPYRHSSYDPRYHYPPPPPPDVGRPGRAQRSPARRRYSWPPQPTCEDEAVSLAKEAGGQALVESLVKDEAGSRGTIDQDPIVQEVPELINRDERRFVVLSDSERETKSGGIPTPPTSEDERVRKARRRPSRLDTRMDKEVPEVSKRTASPYAFTKPTRLQKEVSSNDQYLSPNTLTPPPTDNARRRARYSASSKPSSPRRDSARLSPSARKGRDYFSATYGGDENAVDDYGDSSDSVSRNGRGKVGKAGKAEKESSSATTSSRTSIVDFATTSASAPPIRKLNIDARRNTDTSSTLPSLKVERSRRPSPLLAPGALSELGDSAVYSQPNTPGEAPMHRSGESSYVSSRAVSPASAVSAAQPSPPRSPRRAADPSHEQTAGSSPASRPGSASGSRPSSPSPRIPSSAKTPAESPRLPRTDLDWSTLLAANASRRNKPSQPSRLAESMRQESLTDLSHAQPSHNSSVRHSLPYPEDIGPGTPTMYMPSERDHQYFPSARPSLGVPTEAKTLSRAASPASSNINRTSAGLRTDRPSFSTRHSTANVSPNEERSRLTAVRHNSFTSSSQARKELAALMKKGLPECPRPDPVAGYDDWYTVISAPNLTFCPDCVDQVFERTIFRPSIRRLPQLNFDAKVKCAFGTSAWMRLAWLLSLQQHRTDLMLLKDLADIEDSSDPCPGGREAVRSWYGLRDDEGLFVRDFHICYSDVRKVERLLPTLSGFFVRLPHRASYEKRICAIRAEGNRFSVYLDALISTHEKALASRKGPDAMPFIELVERKTRLRECTRDNMLLGGLWHFIPNLQEFTVCEDCYETVVEPEVRRNSDLAMRFNRTVQPVYGEGMGSSCQLYSRRMRKVFKRAVHDNDLRYLARKAKERREAELMLQERYKEVLRRAKRLSVEGSESEDERRLDREVERIKEEWQAKWE